MDVCEQGDSHVNYFLSQDLAFLGAGQGRAQGGGGWGYDIKAHFTSRILHDLIPYPEKLLIVVFLTGFIFIALIIAIQFGKKLKKELYPLKLSTEKIMNQDLDFEVKNSDVKEFN